MQGSVSVKLREPADERVVAAVVGALRDSAERSEERLSAIGQRAWARSYFWLDASGLALYFLNRLENLAIEDAIPVITLRRLQQNLADNRRRSHAMLAEFASLNRAFQTAGVDYANLKGFTLSPESCPTPELRRQLDFDFLVDGSHLGICREILVDAGYILTGATKQTWEFKGETSELGGMENFYKPKLQRSVELHFASSSTATSSPSRDERLDRLALRSWDGFTFPALSPSEQFVGQALHLFGHLCGASTRPSWVLEYKNHVSFYYSNQDFWRSVAERSKPHRRAPIAIGIASLLSAHLFGGETPAQLDAWTLDCLPASVRLWAEHYGPRTVLADVPGTKLYLLLLQELERDDEIRSSRAQKRSRLLPLHRAPRIVYAGPDDNLLQWFRKEVRQAWFVLFRLRFHAVEGIRYLIETVRWKRQLSTIEDTHEDRPHLIVSDTHQAKD
jgi:Uncharacterised nucleotidyltransferase